MLYFETITKPDSVICCHSATSRDIYFNVNELGCGKCPVLWTGDMQSTSTAKIRNSVAR